MLPPVTLPRPLVSPAVQFAAKESAIQVLSKKRDDLVAQFPGGPFQHSNGSGIGLVYGKLNGIAVYHQTEADKTKVVNHLQKNNIISKNDKGQFVFQDTLVEFKVIGQVVPL
jgi:hypothetical protein